MVPVHRATLPALVTSLTRALYRELYAAVVSLDWVEAGGLFGLGVVVSDERAHH